jgi:hypothetical protein
LAATGVNGAALLKGGLLTQWPIDLPGLMLQKRLIGQSRLLSQAICILAVSSLTQVPSLWPGLVTQNRPIGQSAPFSQASTVAERAADNGITTTANAAKISIRNNLVILSSLEHGAQAR